MPRPSGENTELAWSHERRPRTIGSGNEPTKHEGFRRWLDDIGYMSIEITVMSLPVLAVVVLMTEGELFGLTAAAIVAWTKMVLTAGTIRGGRITPLGTEMASWVPITPALVVLRLGYYNLALAAAAFGGGTIGVVLGQPFLAIVFTLLIAGAAAGGFPRVADTYCRTLSTVKVP
jgi:hypothetical protein